MVAVGSLELRISGQSEDLPLSRCSLRLRHRPLDAVAPARSHRLRPDGRSVDPVGQVRGKRAVGRLGRDQPQVRAYAGEQGGAAAEEDGRDVMAPTEHGRDASALQLHLKDPESSLSRPRTMP